MSHKLFFHFGTDKTGTTAIQEFLHSNPELLEEHGWIYPDFYQMCGLEKKIEDGFMGKNGGAFFSEPKKFDFGSLRWRKIWNQLRKLLQSYNVIISAEEFYSSTPAKFLTQALKEYSEIYVIVYLRRQESWVESRWKQNIKAGKTAASLHSVVLDRFQNGRFTPDYYSLISKIGGLIGEDHIIPRVYEKEQFYRGDIVCDFLHALQVLPDEKDYSGISAPFQNRSLGGYAIEIKRVMNEYYGLELPCNWAIVSFLNDLYTEQSERSYMTDEDRKMILEAVKESNEKLARAYFQRGDGRLFLSGRTPSFYDYSFTPEEKEEIISLTEMLIRQFKSGERK